jgi:NaMN:DMB phosphoribosyltransferase
MKKLIINTTTGKQTLEELTEAEVAEVSSRTSTIEKDLSERKIAREEAIARLRKNPDLADVLEVLGLSG